MKKRHLCEPAKKVLAVPPLLGGSGRVEGEPPFPSQIERKGRLRPFDFQCSMPAPKAFEVHVRCCPIPHSNSPRVPLRQPAPRALSRGALPTPHWRDYGPPTTPDTPIHNPIPPTHHDYNCATIRALKGLPQQNTKTGTISSAIFYPSPRRSGPSAKVGPSSILEFPFRQPAGCPFPSANHKHLDCPRVLSGAPGCDIEKNDPNPHSKPKPE